MAPYPPRSRPPMSDIVVESVYDDMIEHDLEAAIDRFLRKASDYGLLFYELGVRGQYSDMHRKMHKLRKALWDAETLVGEQPDEILQDLIGNCLIALFLLRSYGARREQDEEEASD